MKAAQSSVTRYLTSLAFAGLIVVTGIALVKSGNSVLNFVSGGGDENFTASSEDVEPVIVTATSMDPDTTAPAILPTDAPKIVPPAPATNADPEHKQA